LLSVTTAENGRICTTRAHKNAEYIQRIAAHLITDPKQGITSIIPAETLAQLHTITNPREAIQNKELAILLERNKLPSLKAMVSDPLFEGTDTLYESHSKHQTVPLP
jgi:hypothetical protein